MLTQNQLNDIFTQKFGRNATSNEYSKFSNADLNYINSLASDPTFANVGGTIYNKGTNTPYHNQEEFASALGIADPNSLNFDKFNFDTKYNPATAALNNPPPQFDYGKTYSDALNTSGATIAKADVQKAQDHLNQIDNDLENLYQSKKQQVEASGGIVNETQLRAEVAQEKQPLLIQRSALVRQLSTTQNALNSDLKQADLETQFSQKTFTDQQTQQKDALNTASKVIDAISNGSLDASTIDPNQLAQIEKAAGLPAGMLSKLTAKQAYTAHSFVTDNNGNVTFVGVGPKGTTVQKIGPIAKTKATPASLSAVNGGDASADAQDVLSGRQTLNNIRLQLGRNSAAGAYIQQVKAEIRKVDSKFDFVQSEAGYKFISSAKTQQIIASAKNAQLTANRAVNASDQVNRTNIRFENNLFIGYKLETSDKATAKFITDINALGDEIGTVLGQGSATDFKTQLGLKIADPSLSNEAFKASMQELIDLFQNRIDTTLAQGGQGAVDDQGNFTPNDSSQSQAPASSADLSQFIK
jgi:hypothetical protein